MLIVNVKTVPIGAAGFPVFKLTVEVEVLIVAISLRPVGVLLTIIPTVKPVTSANETSLLVIAVVEVFVSELQVTCRPLSLESRIEV